MSWLHNKHPIVISADLALHVGLNEAIILQQVNYWLENTSSGIEYQGLRWVYNTQEQWREQFPFWSVDTVKRAFASLKKQELILIAKLARDKHDRTNYYTVNHAKLDELYAAARGFPHQCKMPSSKSAKSADGKVQSAPIQEGNLPPSKRATCPVVHTENTTETTSEISTESVGAEAPVADAQTALKKPRASSKFDALSAKPSNVSDAAWSDWCQHRREIRKPLTAKTCEQQAKALEAHQTPDSVINLSISNGWTGLFPEKVMPTNQTQSSRHNGFATRDYTAGLTPREDGTYAF